MVARTAQKTTKLYLHYYPLNKLSFFSLWYDKYIYKKRNIK